ncbi:MAG: porin family protein [Hyphomicrobiales bacterium]|nr:porin family protein [Hyphomicrobiales bacterium]MBV9426237.1 porin family protein [Bradyrhizobiaceae bacterium]
MKPRLSAVFVLLGLATSVAARAADLPAPAVAPAPAVYDWTGFYLGVNAGYGWNTGDGPLTCVGPTGVSFATGCGLIPFAGLKPAGPLGGGQAGYNWQAGQYLVGLESDFQWSDIQGSTRTNGPWPHVNTLAISPATSFFTASHKIDWFGTTRLRIGYAGFDRTLIYATGGLIYARVDEQTAVVHQETGISYPVSESVNRAGWTAGAGIEYAMTRNVTAKLEGLYYDLGEDTISSHSVPLVNGFTRGMTFETRGAIVRAGLNYKFDWGGPVVARY